MSRGLIAGIVTIIIISLVASILVILYSPSTSPFPSIRDTDGDGVVDAQDAFPEDCTEWVDTDNDGYGDNCDRFPLMISEWNDTDGDGHGDNSDLLPLNPNEWEDLDGDGIPDNQMDEFPDDPLEWRDLDDDGVGDNDDFYDSGNGKVKLSITEFKGGYEDEGCLNRMDPYFDITVIEMDDGVITASFQNLTPIQTNTTHLLNASFCVFEYDISDDTDTLYIVIVTRDGDEVSINEDDPLIDCNELALTEILNHTLTEPFDANWSHDGSLDWKPDERDCILEVIVEMEVSAPVVEQENDILLELPFEDELFYSWLQNGTEVYLEKYLYIPDEQIWEESFVLLYPGLQQYFEPDFDNFSYVYVDLGDKQIAGYSIQVMKIVLDNATLKIYVYRVEPNLDYYYYYPTHAHDFIRIRNSHLASLEICEVKFYNYIFGSQPSAPTTPIHQYIIQA